MLADRLRVRHDDFLFGNHFGPGNTISIVTGDPETRAVRKAIWWLYLQQTPEGLRPHRDYFSVNTNYQKLAQKAEYRHHRCIVPATAFVESQDGKHPHLLEPADGGAMAFGGLYKEWTDRVTGEMITSASIITLAGIKALENIHRKSVPLWLPEDAYEDWLSPNVTDPAALAYLLEPTLQSDLIATPIDRAGTKKPVGTSFVVKADAV